MSSAAARAVGRAARLALAPAPATWYDRPAARCPVEGGAAGKKRVRLSGANYGLPDVPVERVLAFHAEIGCPAVELTVLPQYATALERLDAAERARVRGLLRQYGLTCSAIANVQRLTDPDPAAAAAVLARQRAGIDLAVDLALDDTPPVVCFAGGTPDEWPAARERLIERLGALAEHARSRGVTLAFKAHVASAVRRPAQLLDLFEQIGSPALRFCFDMSHYETQGLSIEQALYPLAPLTVLVEAKAARGRYPDHEFLVPGEPDSQSDFVAQFRALAALGYRGWIVPEISVHVQRRPGYDPFAALRQAYVALGASLSAAGVPPRAP